MRRVSTSRSRRSCRGRRSSPPCWRRSGATQTWRRGGRSASRARARVRRSARAPRLRAWPRAPWRADGRPTGSMSRRRISSGGPWEAFAGYSRALVVGDACWVAGTTDAGPDGESRHPDDAAGQALAAWAIVEGALTEAGFELGEVVRTRMYVTDRDDIAAVTAVHGDVFRDVRPAATLVLVAGLMRPSLRVEVEADAVRSRP